MPDRTRTPWTRKRGLYFVAEFGEVVVSTNDTVTFDSISTAAGSLLRAHAIRKSNGAVTTSTEATNVMTITQAGLTNEPCIYIAYGVRAE